MFLDPCITVQFIKKIQKMQQCIKILLFYIYMKLNMFWATQRPSSGAQDLHWQLLVLHTWDVVGCMVGRRCQAMIDNVHVWKTRGSQWSFRLLMMGGVSPETCLALYKYGIIKFWYIIASCWIFLYELSVKLCTVPLFHAPVWAGSKVHVVALTPPWNFSIQWFITSNKTYKKH
jgi:hypothetical protein